MSKFNNILRRVYDTLLEQEGQLPPEFAEAPGADLGAAAPPQDSMEMGTEEEPPQRLSSSAEANLVKLMRYALFTCIPDDDFPDHDGSVPQYEEINESNSKQALDQMIDILKQYNPEFASLDETSRAPVEYKGDVEALESIPSI